MSISFKARQRFRQRLYNIEDADEIMDALDNFVNRFKLLSGQFSSANYETIYEYTPVNNETVMLAFSIVAKESVASQAGLKRTAVFYKQNDLVSEINAQQTDYTNKSNQAFNARFLVDNDKVLLQVKGASNNLTQWSGSIEIEKLGD